MFILIFANGRYTVCQKKSKKKIGLKTFYTIAAHKSKSVLQEVADNLNKQIPAVPLLNLSTSDLVLNISTSDVNLNTENIYALDKNSCDIEQHNKYDKNNNNATCCDDASANDEIRDYALSEDISNTDKNSNKLTNNSNIINDSSLIDTAILDIDTAININTSDVNLNIENIYAIDKNACDIKQRNKYDKNDSNATFCANANNEIRDYAYLPEDTSINIDKNSNKLIISNNSNIINDSSLIDTAAILDIDTAININTSDVKLNIENIYALDKNSCDIEQRNKYDKNDNNATFCNDANANDEIRDYAYLPENTSIINKNSNLTNNSNIINDSLLIDTAAILDIDTTLNINTSDVKLNIENIYALDKNSCDIEQRNNYDKNDNNATFCNDANANDEIRDYAYLPENTSIINKNSNLTNNSNIINDSLLIDTAAILDIDTTLNISTLNTSDMNPNIEYICAFNKNCDIEQCNIGDKIDNNIMFCDANANDEIETENIASNVNFNNFDKIDKNSCDIEQCNIRDKNDINLTFYDANTNDEIETENITSNVNFNNFDKIDKNSCDIEQCNIRDIEQCNIRDKNDINLTFYDANTNDEIETENISKLRIISNVKFNNTYSIIDKKNSLNKTYVDNILNSTLVDFAPLAESTFTKEKSTPECMSTNANIESDNSLTSEHNMDDSFHLSDCSISEDTDEDEPTEHANHTSINKTMKSTLNLTTSLHSSKINICDDRNMYVETSDNLKLKLSMCPYCKKLQSQFARHLETVHKTEEDVKKFCFLPKGNPERKKIINIIRRTGNFIYNTDSNINKGNLIVCRRPAKKLNKQAIDFLPCAKCKGYFTKNNIRHHFKLCTQKTEYRQRNIKVLGRTIACRIHYTASALLRRLVFPVMKEDNITQLIRYDELLIAYGNKMCMKYRLQHQHDMIRARLRLLGRFLAATKEIDNTIVDFTSIYNPKRYDYCVKAVNNLAQFDETTSTYKTPSIASSLGTLIKQVGQILRSMCIKKQEFDNQIIVENFLKLFEEDYPVSINKVVHETQGRRMRQKNIILPSMDDIKILNSYLKDERTKALKTLQKDGFSIEAWRILAETTLVSTMIFNRRRAGELERILIEDLKNPAAISKEEAPELQKSLSKYVRITIRGKLARTVPVLLHEEVLSCMQMIIDYRKYANVPVENPYVFGINTIDKKRHKYLRACVLMRKYSVASGTKMPTSLRGTILRKHIATICITLDVSENQVSDLANFMGHHEKIHKSHYRQSVITKDLAISRLLKFAQGEDTSDESNESQENENVESDSEYNTVACSNTSNTSNTLSISKNISQFKLFKNEDETNNTLKKRKRKVHSLDSTKKIKENSRKKTVYDNENVRESNNEYIDSSLNSSISQHTSRILKQSKKVFSREDDENSSTEKRKKKISPFGSKRRKTNKIRWTDDERTAALSSFSVNIKSNKLPSFRQINEVKVKYPVLKNRTNAQIKSWINNQIKAKN